MCVPNSAGDLTSWYVTWSRITLFNVNLKRKSVCVPDSVVDLTSWYVARSLITLFNVNKRLKSVCARLSGRLNHVVGYTVTNHSL